MYALSYCRVQPYALIFFCLLQAWQIAQEKTEAAAREVAQANISAESANKALLEAQKQEALVKQEAQEHNRVGSQESCYVLAVSIPACFRVPESSLEAVSMISAAVRAVCSLC